MSSGGGGGVGGSIPGSVRRTIQDIKEIARGHTDDEVYAMLRDCNMDPNETAQRLLLQDTFHEVKRKRDKRKENPRESADTRWRGGTQGRGVRGGRGNYTSRYISNDAGGGRSANAGKENGDNQGASSPITHETENKSIISGPSCVAGLVNGPIKVEHPISSHGSEIHAYGLEGTTLAKENSGAETTKLGASPPVSIVNSGTALEDSGPISDQFHSSITPASALGVYAPVSDPVLVPSHDSRVPGMTGVIKREVGSQRTVVETSISKIASRDLAGSESLTGKLSSEVNSSCTQAKVQGKSQGFEANQLSDASVAAPSMTGSTGSRPSSNYSSRSQQQSVSQKVGPTKEWKPKPTQVNPSQPSAIHGAVCASEVTHITKEDVEQSPFPSSSTASEDTALKLQKKLEELHFSDTKHVIIPNHLQVPESERTGLSFGSFDTSFVLGTGFADSPDDDKNSTPLSVSSQEIEENDEEPASSIHVASSIAQETDYQDHPPPMQMPEDLSSGEADVVPSVTSAVPEYDQSKLDSALAPEGPQYSVVHTAPTYSTFGMLPQIFGSQFAPFEATDSQSRDASRLPSFVVPQPFDPSTNFYAQVYRPTADGDGRFSPFIPSTPATKLNGNVAVLPAQTGQSPQESGSSLVPSAAGPTPLATQAAGLMQSNLAVNQQAVPVFRQAAAVHMPFPPNYLPYTQYFSPFFVPPPTIHPFINNAAFPQQPPTGSIYPTPAGAGTANPVKYSISQFKPGTNTGNPIGIPAGYGTYSSNPTGYTPNPSASSGNSAGNEDTIASQYKENNVYITGQQSEGSAVWMPAPARDISGLQGNSYYGLPPQGPHMSFAPTQAGHGAFAGMYHPNQTVATNVHSLLQQTQSMAGTVEMVGAPAGVYQQPQRAQVNWANNY